MKTGSASVLAFVLQIHRCGEPKFLESSACKAMAQKSPTISGNNLPYGDLTSEVTRRRVTMATRKERFTKKSDEARVISSPLDLEQVPSSVAGPTEPLAPPPSPVEDCRI